MESFITKYLALADHPETTWIYCRLVDETALLGLSASNEPLATAVFVALCYNPIAPDMTVWAIPSLSCISYEDVVRAHCIAEALMDEPTNLADETPITKEAETMVDKLKGSVKSNYSKFMKTFGPPVLGWFSSSRNRRGYVSGE